MSETPGMQHKTPVIALDVLVAVGILIVIAVLYRFAGARTAGPTIQASGASEIVVDVELERGTSMGSMEWKSGNLFEGVPRVQLLANLHKLRHQEESNCIQDASISTIDASHSSFETSVSDVIYDFPLPPKKAVVHDSSGATESSSDIRPNPSLQEHHLSSFVPHFSTVHALRSKLCNYSPASSHNPSFEPTLSDYHCATHAKFGDTVYSIPPCEDHLNFDTFMASGIIAHSSPPRPRPTIKRQACARRCTEYGYF